MLLSGQGATSQINWASSASVTGTEAALFNRTMETPVKILAVDDEPSVTRSLRYVFSGSRYEVTCVGDGADALARLDADQSRFDVIIVDQKMPNLTGVQLVEAIRKRGISGKVIVVSAHISSEIREAYERMDVHILFSKPFNVDQLRSAVDYLIT